MHSDCREASRKLKPNAWWWYSEIVRKGSVPRDVGLNPVTAVTETRAG